MAFPTSIPGPDIVRSVVLAALLLLAACGGDETASVTTTDPPPTTIATTTESPTTTTTTTPPTTTLPPSTTEPGVDLAGAVGPDTPSIATATVQLIQLDSRSGDLEFGCFSGSGSIIRDDGLILTNAHVVENDPSCPYDTLGVAVLGAADEPPMLRYLGVLLVVDSVLDLAVVKVASDLDGQGVDLEFPFLSIGDSESVDLGDSIRVLGYPAIGGETITLTLGAVSGFTEERDVDGRAWIKTDATISGGNSGGTAVDEDGQLVGVPTIAGSGANVDPTDCRAIQDTNGDGFLDDRDSCVPIGGFINGLRPINLALPLIEDADSATPISLEPITTPDPPVEVTNVDLGPISFSTGVTDSDEPIDDVGSIPSGVTDRVCGFWDYDGMVDGASFDALWYLDGDFIEEASILDTDWFGGVSGNWWVCFIGSDGSVSDGTYELVLNVQGELAESEAIVVGGDGVPTEFEMINETDDLICFVLISLSDAQNWGPDELGPTETIPPLSSRVFELPPAVYDIRALDCDGDVMSEEFSVDVTGSRTYTVGS